LVDKRFEEQVKGLSIQADSMASINLTYYSPETLKYESNAASEQLAVFSDIYYPKGWNAFIDGKPVEHIRTDYVLRGLRVPAGKHEIEFRFEPESYRKGETIATIGSSVLLILAALAIFAEVRKKKTAAS
jgi:uncharacterized membrane protein YfhO